MLSTNHASEFEAAVEDSGVPQSGRDSESHFLLGKELVANAELQVAAPEGFRVAVSIPGFEELTSPGDSPRSAFATFSEKVCQFAFSNSTVAYSLLNKLRGDIESEALTIGVDQDPPKSDVSGLRRPKRIKKTIGVCSKSDLKEAVQALSYGHRFAENARTLFSSGFTRMDDRLDVESSDRVLKDFNKAYTATDKGSSCEWMLRIDAKLYGRALVLANEYGLSMSKLAGMCIAYACEAERK